MKQLFPLAWAGLKSRKRSTALLLSAIILSVVFLVVMGIISSSSDYTMRVQNRDAYGEQNVVAWNLTEDQQLQFEVSSVWDSIGKMTIYGIVDASVDTSTVFGIGTIDEQALEMGHIRLAEGRFPEKANEVVLEKNVYKYIGNQPYSIGDSIVLEGTDYTVVGFLENYSAVWQNQYSVHINNDYFAPVTVSFLISEAGTENFSDGSITATWLLHSDRNSYTTLSNAIPKSVYFDFNDKVYPNISYFSEHRTMSVGSVSIASLIGGMIMVCMMMVVLNGFLMSVERRKQQFSLLRCIGATKKQACEYIFCEGFLLMGMGIPVGLILGVLLSFGAVKAFAALNGATMLYSFNPWTLVEAVLVCVVCVCVALLIPAVRTSRMTPVAGMAKVSFKRQRKKKNGFTQNAALSPFGLMLISLRKSKGKMFLTTVTFALVITVFTTMMLYYYETSQTPYETANVTLSVLTQQNVVEGGYITVDDGSQYVVAEGETYNTVLQEVSEKVRDVVPVAYQSISVKPHFTCLMPVEQYDHYLNGHFHYDLEDLGVNSAEDYGMYQYYLSEQQQYGYSDREYLLEPDIVAFDEGLLETVSHYVVDGKVDPEAINRGEEIILSMPDYALTIHEDADGSGWGGSSVSPVWANPQIEKNTEICTNTNWKAGDTLTFTWVESKGGTYQKHNKTVRIGAVIKDPIPVEGRPVIFGMIVGEQTLENLGLPYEANRQYIYFQPDVDIVQAEEEVKQFVAQNYPQLNISTRTEENMTEQQLRRTVVTVIGLVLVCLLAIGFLGLINTVSSRIHSRLHEIGLLRSVGMTKGQVYRMLIYEGAVFGILPSLLSVAVCFILLPQIRWYWLETEALFYLVLSCIVCIVLSILTIFLPARTVMKYSPAEITRGNE